MDTNSNKESFEWETDNDINGEISTSETTFLQVGLMFSNMAADFPIYSHSPNRQRDLWDNSVRERPGGLSREAYASEKVQDPIFEEETARRGPLCGGTKHGSDPITSYVTIVVFDPYVICWIRWS